MYDKNFYRTSLNALKRYVKLGCFCDDIGLSRTSLSMFLKNDNFDYYISIETLDKLYTTIQNYFKNSIA